MADFRTVMDKLHSFDSADDLAEFLRGYGVKAEPSNAKACAISKFVEMETDVPSGNITTTTEAVTLSVRHVDYDDYEFNEDLDVVFHNEALIEFVRAFDRGAYPDLVVDGYTFPGEGYCNCSVCQEH